MPNHWCMSAFDVQTRGARNTPDENVNSSDEYRVNSRQSAVNTPQQLLGTAMGIAWV